MKENEILNGLYKKSLSIIKDNKNIKFHEEIIKNVDVLITNIDKNKSILSALVTSLLKKIVDPDQDVRLHRTDFKKGYSARSLDTKITAPFFKKYFPKYANKESAFLTLATRERIKWTLSAGVAIKVRNEDVKKSFLKLLDLLENKKIKSENCLIYIFIKLHNLSLQYQQIFDETIESISFSDIININTVIEMLEKHFSIKLSSRLPVIAIFTIYQHLLNTVKRYENKLLLNLNVHTSADKHGFGDVEIHNKDNEPFEVVEIKHNIAINRNMIFDIVLKAKDTTIKRYYILTTCKNNFESDEEQEYINKFILKIKKDFHLEIIANGIINTLKYYLRFIDDYKAFIKDYTINLIEDAKNSTEINEQHISEWKNLLKEHKIL